MLSVLMEFYPRGMHCLSVVTNNPPGCSNLGDSEDPLGDTFTLL